MALDDRSLGPSSPIPAARDRYGPADRDRPLDDGSRGRGCGDLAGAERGAGQEKGADRFSAYSTHSAATLTPVSTPRMHMRRASRVGAIVVLAAGILWAAPRLGGQQAAATPFIASTAKGDWPSYTGDARGTRYSPLDQITPANFNDLEVAWRFKTDNLGTRSEYKLEGTPLVVNGRLYTTAGTRRSVISLDAATGELLWVHRYPEGVRGANAPRQLSGRGLAYWTDGRGDDRVLYITPGYRLIALSAKTGQPIPTFGKDGVVDLKVGVVYGTGQQIDLETGEIGVHSTPVVVKDTIIVGSSMKEGMTITTHNNTKGLVRAFDARTGKLQWTFNTIPHPGEVGNDTWL